MTKEKVCKAHILIVDDDPNIHKLLVKLFESEGFKTTSAYSANQAYEEIEKERPDLILLDIMMPIISGIEVINKLKSDEKYKDILIVVISARDKQADRIKGLSLGADDYVSKPFHLKSLIRKIEHMIGERKSVIPA